MAIDRIAIPLPSAEPEDVGMSPAHLSFLDTLVNRHIEQGRYPGAQYAVARNGKLVWHRTSWSCQDRPYADWMRRMKRSG